MIRLSIIVPFYNVEKYIEQCIRSLYDQDIPQEEYEVICVDDCSPDGSRAIVERLQAEYPTLRLIIHESNKKLGGARNTGLRAAKGKYIWFVDSDDYIIPNCLGRLLKDAAENKLDMLHFDCLIDANDIISQNITNYQTMNVVSGTQMFFDQTHIWWKHLVVAWRKIFNRDFLLKNRLFFEEDIMYEDNDFAFRCFMSAFRCKHTNFEPYVYRENPSSVTRVAMSISRLQNWLKVCVVFAKNSNNWGKGDIRFKKEAINFISNQLYKVFNSLENYSSKERRECFSVISILDWSHILSCFDWPKRTKVAFLAIKLSLTNASSKKRLNVIKQ